MNLVINMAIRYELIKECKQTGARYGILHTPHGSFETPIFMPVGTKAAVKTLDPQEVKEVSDGLILGNTYHLWLQPGDEIVKDHGRIRGFMKWDGALLTDSGGFQVFSLSDIRKITEEGVEFRHHKSGEKLFMSPEDSIKIQNNLGADIIMSFDECPPFDESYEYMKKSVERTLRWAQRGKKEHKRPLGPRQHLLFQKRMEVSDGYQIFVNLIKSSIAIYILCLEYKLFSLNVLDMYFSPNWMFPCNTILLHWMWRVKTYVLFQLHLVYINIYVSLWG